MNSCIAAIQMTSNANINENLAQAEKYITEAVNADAKLVVLPEMFAIMGVDQLDKVKVRETFGQGVIQDFLREQAIKHHIWLVGGTIPLLVPDAPEKVHATSLLFNDQGEVAARYDKIHLFDVNIHATRETYQESKTTFPGKEITVIPTPFGRLGLAVCYDIRFPEFFRAMSQQQVELVVLPAAFTYTTGAVHWDTLVRARAIENQIYLIAAAQTGAHKNGRKTYGHSMIVDPWGIVKASLPEGEGFVVAEIDLKYLYQLREEFPVLSHRCF